MNRFVLGLVCVFGLAVATRAAAAPSRCPTPSSTYELIQHGIFEPHGCTVSYCHGAARADGLDLRAGASYGSLLHHQDVDEEPDQHDPEEDYALVVPGHPDDSLLWLTLAAKTLRLRGVPAPPMPIGGLPISRSELEAVRLWILAGAPETGIVNRVANLIEACPPQSSEGDENLPPCDPEDRHLLLPDLIVDPPKDVRVRYYAGHRQLEFTTAVGNVGDGPLVIQAAERATHPGQTLGAVQVILRRDGSKCVRPAGAIRFADDGERWAYGHTVNFELRKGDPLTGDVVALTSKTSYCLLDTDPIRGMGGQGHQFEAHCTDNIGRMGISSGFKDVYLRGVHPGQWIDLDADPETAIEPGTYYLVNVVNPTSTLWEDDDSRQGNLSYTQIRVSLADPDGSQVRPTATPTPRPTRPPHSTLRTPRPTRPPHPTRPPRLPHNPRALPPR
jgi:hypothetical protein